MALKLIQTILLAAVKFNLTLPYALIIGLDYKYAILAVLFGGIGGFLFFYYLSTRINRNMDALRPRLCRLVPGPIKRRYRLFCERQTSKPRKRFSRRNRFLVRVKTTYGLWGIVIATPVFLTIPIGAFLANKYYSRRKNVVPYMILSIVGWGGVVSGLVHLFPKVFF